jgi:hypothetical protein
MPTPEDKNSADIAFLGEANKLTIRKPRVDRDGLYLFGRRFAAQLVTLSEHEIEDLKAGRTIVIDILGEYILYIHHEAAAGEDGIRRGRAEPTVM